MYRTYVLRFKVTARCVFEGIGHSVIAWTLLDFQEV